MDNLNNIILSTRQSQYKDGLMELMLGTFMLISAVALGLVPHPVLSGVVAVIGIVAAARSFELLKSKLSYPRAGFVRYHEQAGKGKLMNALTAFVIMLTILGIFVWMLIRSPETALGWLALLVGSVIGLALISQGIFIRLWRLVFLGAISLLLGLGLSPIILKGSLITGFAGISLMAIYFFGLGLSLSLSGVMALSRFLKTQPVEKEE